MSFASLGQPPLVELIDRFARAEDVTLLIGAGASVEADLPGWSQLIARLLATVAEAQSDLPDPETKSAWARATLERNDLLGAAAVVEVMAPAPLDVLVPRHLYGAEGASGFLPGPIARQVAALKVSLADRLEILTTNYDDLIERALLDSGIPQSRIRSYIQARDQEKRAPGAAAVTHLHGFAGRTGDPKRIVLTEEDYHRMQRGSSWQERLVTRRLEESLCLFVGMSLTDPNLIRYLYGYQQSEARQHAAVFVRQGDEGLPEEVRRGLERAAIKRWARCGVKAVFIDHYADAAQLLYEIGHSRQAGSDYEPIGTRADRLIGDAERTLLLAEGGQAAYAERQVVLSEWLRALLQRLIRVALDGADQPDDEQLALALWLISRDGARLTGWAHSDRAHQDPTTILPVPITSSSDWVSIRTVCRGATLELDRNVSVSRWRFVRGLPLVVDEPSRVPVGCLTISSTKPGGESVLKRMPPDKRAGLNNALVDAAKQLIAVRGLL